MKTCKKSQAGHTKLCQAAVEILCQGNPLHRTVYRCDILFLVMVTNG